MTASANIIDRDVVIVGGGFGGCYLLHLLRKEGFSCVLLEAAKRLGGVWAWSCYPGARVDVELPWYGFSDEEIWSTWNWTERFPGYKELRKYFDHVDKVWGLSADTVMETHVTESRWDDEAGVWMLQTAGGKQYRCKWFLAATGTSFKQNLPNFKGREAFKGHMHHSAAWPEEGLQLEGKRVAVIGAGSTGVQVMQECAKVCSSVVEYIRSPNLAIPLRQRQITEDEIYQNKQINGHVFAALRTTRSGVPVTNAGKRTFDDSKEERMQLWEELWKRGGFNWTHGGYIDLLFSKEANREAYSFWRDKTRQRITDPQKADLLAPQELPYWMSTKRPSMEIDYFEMCDQPNVEITNSPITEITETGIVTADGKTREFDIIAMCTGYDAVTGGLRTMGIKGRNGIDLDEKWKDGVVTHLGMMMNGYPNMFMVYGPQAPTSLTNGPPFIELQCEWIRDVLKKQRGEKFRTVEAAKAEEEAWRDHTLDLANQTLAVETDSWWNGGNVAGKRKEFLLYFGGIPMWHEACQKALENWSGFEVKPAQLSSL